MYVIECRNEQGRLDFSGPQPEEFFGIGAIQGISTDQMAKAVWRHVPDADFMHGDNVSAWPSLIDPRFIARVKYW